VAVDMESGSNQVRSDIESGSGYHHDLLGEILLLNSLNLLVFPRDGTLFLNPSASSITDGLSGLSHTLLLPAMDP
jgi:hypothetical protein